MKNYKIRKTAYFIEIIRLEDGRKEMIRLRKASKNIYCVECDQIIKKGDKYIRDRFSASSLACEYVGKRTNDICLTCWRGEIPKLLSTNVKKVECEYCGKKHNPFINYCNYCGYKKQCFVTLSVGD